MRPMRTVLALLLLSALQIPRLRPPDVKFVGTPSHKFDMGDEWPPEQSQDVNGLMIYLWTIH